MDTVIVTVTDRTWSFRCDLELPTSQPVSVLKRGIVEALNAYDSNLALPSGGVTLVNLRTRQVLEDHVTLDMAGVWNGDYIQIGGR